MKFLIASDLHGSLPALSFICEKARAIRPDMLILLGDLVYHGPRNPLPDGYDTRSILSAMPDITALPCPVTAVRGNCDAEVDIDHLPFPLAENAWIDADGLRIFACHGHHLPENPPIPGMPRGSVILRGHTHTPRGETLAGIHFWNPGSLSLPKEDCPKSYGIYENGVFSVFSMNDEKILSHRPE